MMNIAYIDPYPVPDYRVASLQIVQMIDAMARSGCDVYMVSPQSPLAAKAFLGRDTDARVHFTGLKNIRKTWFFPFNSQKIFNRQVSGWLKKNPVDAVFTRNLKMANYLLQTHPDIPCFFEGHEVFSQSFRESHEMSHRKNQRKLARLLTTEAAVYRGCAAVFVKTSLIKEDAQRLYQPETPVFVTGNGVDLLAVQAQKALPVSAENHSGTQLLYLGSLHPWKGLPTIIRALPLLDNVRLNVAGGKPDQIAVLQSLAADLGVSDRICFMGYVEPVKRFGAIAASDICVLPLTDSSMGGRYTSPLKLFEYMAMKKPVIISDLPSVRSVAGEDMVTFAVSGDAASFADAVRRVTAHPDDAARKADNAFARIQTEFNWDTCAQETLRHIRTTLDTASRPS